MNDGFPPLQMVPPEKRRSRKGKGRFVPLPPERQAFRREKANILRVKIDALAGNLKQLSDGERRAVFYKLENEKPLNPDDLSGTDLKPVAQPSPETVYVVAKAGTLDKFAEKIDQFGEGKHNWLAYLEDVTQADPKERLSDDFRRDYDNLVKGPPIICEIEFLSLLTGANRSRKAKEELDSWIAELQQLFASGTQGNLFEHEVRPPSCRAVIRCSGEVFRQLVEEPRWIVRIRSIESRPRFQTFTETLANFRFQDLAPIGQPPSDASVVCVIDGGVTAGNPFLQPVTREELLYSYLPNRESDPNDHYGHGSAVAGLVAYHQINIAEGAVNTPLVWIASARILNEHNQLDDEQLLSKVLTQIVEDFRPRGIRIFCLAIGDESRVWSEGSKQSISRKSWVARRIDQLSREHDVVFVTCTGNLNLAHLNQLVGDGHAYPGYLAHETAKILDPGQAALAITVGSIASSTTVMGRGVPAMALAHQPSPFSRSGPGIRRETKPEVVEYGGNLAHDTGLNRVRENPGLQVISASKELTPAIGYWSGTSFAAPKVAHTLALIDRDLRAIGLEPTACLLRAFLVNSARHPDGGSILAALGPDFAQADPEQLSWLAGYGVPDGARATGCNDYETVLYYQGSVEADHVHFFELPVPTEFVGSTSKKRFTITVAHAPEVQRWGLERYLGIDVKWRLFRGDTSRDEIIEAMTAQADESDEELPGDIENFADEDATSVKELAFVPSFIKRSRGTIQHACFDWTRHQEAFSDNHYMLAVLADKRWSRKVSDTPLAVVARLEDLGREVAAYSRIRDILVEIEQRTRTRT
jgi:hypothetical protein